MFLVSFARVFTFRVLRRPALNVGNPPKANKIAPKGKAEKKQVALQHTSNHMATKLYVGGLPYSTSQDELQNAFSKAGTVTSANIIMDKMTNRSRGFGFVEMATDEDAQKAIEMWNGQDFDGRKLTVNEAKPLEARAPRREGGGDRFQKRQSW